ncbi:MAG: DUF5117 domain-containing protein, partial [Armatimonadota bacterium]
MLFPRPSRVRLVASAFSLTFGTLLSVSSATFAQLPLPTPTPAPPPRTPVPAPAPTAPGTPAAQTAPTPGAAAIPRTVIKPYTEVVKGAKTQEGLFKVHRIDNRALYEIPAAAQGKEMLWVTTLAKTQTGYGYGGTEVQNRVVRWEKREDKILLRGVGYELRTQENGGLKRSLERSSVEPILQVFDVLAYAPDKSPVIDVTALFTTEVPEFSAKRVLNAGAVDARRSFLEKVRPFPRNIEV